MNIVLHLLKKNNARVHLKYICPHCPMHKRETRDVKHKKRCYWRYNWSKGRYDYVPMWMGIKNSIRLYVFRKPIQICIKGKIYKADKI